MSPTQPRRVRAWAAWPAAPAGPPALSLTLLPSLRRMVEYSLDLQNINLSAIRTVRVLRPLKAINRVPSELVPPALSQAHSAPHSLRNDWPAPSGARLVLGMGSFSDQTDVNSAPGGLQANI